MAHCRVSITNKATVWMISNFMFISTAIADTATPENETGIVKVIASGIGVAAAVVLLLANLVQLKKVRKDVSELKVVVKDTKEIREALSKSFEGDWKVKGKFSKFQGKSNPHYSTGLASFSWSPDEARYNVNYVYSVQKEKSDKDEITCFSNGQLSTDYDGRLSAKEKISINFEIHSRTSTAEYEEAESKHFSLENGSYTIANSGRATELKFKFETDDTKGIVKFVR